MEYLDSKLTKPIRRTIFIVFFAIFIILTPSIILYTDGYRYDWHNGLLREMGAISIDIEPSNASVYLDNLKIQSSMPIRLKNISPRKYHIKISATGYYDWERDIEVKNKQTVYIKEIGLIKKNTPTLLVTDDIQTLSLSPNNNYLTYIAKHDQKLELHLIEIAGTKDKLLTTLRADTSYKISWADNDEYFSLADEQDAHGIFSIFQTGSDKIIDLTTLAKKPIRKYQWKNGSEPELFFSSQNEIFTIRPNTQNIYRIGTSSWIDWYAEQGQFWTLQTVTSTGQIKVVQDTFGFSSDFAILNNITHPEIKPDNPNLKIIKADNERVLIKFNDRENTILTTRYNAYDLVGSSFDVSRYYNWLLIWTPWELWTHTIGEEPYLLNRSGEGLRLVLPLDKYNTLAMFWNNKATILYPYYQVTHDFIDTPATSAVADTENKIIYFISKIDKTAGVWKLNY